MTTKGRKRQLWEQVDWVELGCRGWEIDETGAGLYDPPDDSGVQWRGELGFAHLDFTTLHLFLDGPPALVQRVYNDLVAAGIVGPTWYVPITVGTTAGGTITTGSSTEGIWVT
jgi:hypothetical protein